ncbi:MAG: tail fiber domain-containing protein, partial [Candidatus Kapaibacterium sp.]
DIGTDTAQFLLFDPSSGSASFWLIGGNAGTTAGTNYIGTNDDQAFQIHVDDGNSSGSNGRGRVMLFEPNASSANIIGGFKSNTVSSGIVGATISGGGKVGGVNTISSDYSTIGGGAINSVGISSVNSTIAGGVSNTITGSAQNGTIAGGLENQIVSGDHSTISGGFNNIIQAGAFGSTVSGGTNNQTSSWESVIGGGDQNTIGSSSLFSTIAGGNTNSIDNSSSNSTIGGGIANSIGASNESGTVGGGNSNTIGENSDESIVGGGLENSVDSSAARSTIGGGYRNFITTGAGSSTIAGGEKDTIENGSWQSTIGGGGSNKISASSWQSTIAGGGSNTISSNSAGSAIGGGVANTIGARMSAIPGGRGLTLNGQTSFGFLANDIGSRDMTISAASVSVFGNTDLWLANNDNTARQIRFYEAYNTAGAFPNGTNYTSFQAQGQTADIEYILPAAAGTVGQQLTISGIAGTQVTLGWAAASDRAKKTNFLTLSGESVLNKFRNLELGTWRYDPAIDPKGTRHYGIMAQDFHATFGNDGLGEIGTDTTVTNLDLHGVSYLAIQGLEQRTSGNSETIRAQAGHIEELEAEVEKLRKQAGCTEELRGEVQNLRVQIGELRRMLEEK